jgi:hypothetical protein
MVSSFLRDIRRLLTTTRIEALLRLSVIRGVSKPTPRQPRADPLAFVSMLCHLFTHARLQALPETTGFLHDAAMPWADELTDEQRVGALARAVSQATEALRPLDARVAYLFGAPATRDGWLRVVLSSPSSSLPPTAAGGPAAGSPGVMGAPALVSPGGARAAMGGTPQTPRPMQQQQQQQRVGGGAAGPQSPSVRVGAQQLPQAGGRSFGPAVAFPLKHWELLPDQGASGGAANDTAISLALVGMRRA